LDIFHVKEWNAWNTWGFFLISQKKWEAWPTWWNTVQYFMYLIMTTTFVPTLNVLITKHKHSNAMSQSSM
jgi:hypothetical protein